MHIAHPSYSIVNMDLNLKNRQSINHSPMPPQLPSFVNSTNEERKKSF
jgi:hypothetical protein